MQIQNKITEAVLKTFKDIRLEIISRSGLIPYESTIGHSSEFDMIWDLTSRKLVHDLFSILKEECDDLNKALQEYKENFINTFMILHHKYLVGHGY